MPSCTRFLHFTSSRWVAVTFITWSSESSFSFWWDMGGLCEIGNGADNSSIFLGRLMSILYGVGAALTLDEFALWLNLKDVYWAREGRASIDAVILFRGSSWRPEAGALRCLTEGGKRRRRTIGEMKVTSGIAK